MAANPAVFLENSNVVGFIKKPGGRQSGYSRPDNGNLQSFRSLASNCLLNREEQISSYFYSLKKEVYLTLLDWFYSFLLSALSLLPASQPRSITKIIRSKEASGSHIDNKPQDEVIQISMPGVLLYAVDKSGSYWCLVFMSE